MSLKGWLVEGCGEDEDEVEDVGLKKELEWWMEEERWMWKSSMKKEN